MQALRNLLSGIICISRGEELGKKDVFHAGGLADTQGMIPIMVGGDIARYEVTNPARYIKKTKKNMELYKSPKLVIVKTGNQCIAAFDDKSTVTMQSVYNVKLTSSDTNILSLLGLLNSHLVRFWIAKTCTAYKFLFPQLNQSTVETIPVPVSLAARQKDLAQLVERMLKLHKDRAGAWLAQEKAMLQQQIEATDAQIDKLVYELYGLTEEEIKIVEGTA